MSALHLPGPVVSVEWLKAHLGHPDLVLLDAVMAPVMPGAAKPEAVPPPGFLPGARVFDVQTGPLGC